MPRTRRNQMSFNDVQLDTDDATLEALNDRKRLKAKRREADRIYAAKDKEAKALVDALRHDGKPLQPGVKYWLGEHQIRVKQIEEKDKTTHQRARRAITFPEPKAE